MNPNSPQSRRSFLKRGSATVAGSAVAGGLPMLAFGAEAALAADAAAQNPVVRENTQSDQSTWSTNFQVVNPSSMTEGYSRRPSVNLGEPVDLVVTGPSSWYSGEEEPDENAQIELYRLGYYGGKGGRLVWTSPVKSSFQRFDEDGNPSNDGVEPPLRPVDAATGLKGEADLHTTFTVPPEAIPASGAYLAKIKGTWLTYPPGVPAVPVHGESHIVFVVRDDNRPRDILCLLPTNTWQAYNYWGDRSLYTYNSRYGNMGSIVSATGTERAAKVSFDRPHNNWVGDLNWILRTEFPAIYWIEQQGYDVAYTEDVALTFDPAQALPAKSKGVLILGHGEYWTQGLRDGIEAARDAGTSIYNFGANTGFWRVRYETQAGQTATSIADARVMVCYKTIEGGGAASTVASKADPVGPTTTWRDTGKGPGVTNPGTALATPTTYAGPNRPERSLFGVQYFGDDDATYHGLTVPADNGKGEFAGHTAWRHTTISTAGKKLGTTLLGWEWDGIPAAGQPFGGSEPATKAGSGGVKRLAESDPRLNLDGTSHAMYLVDAGRDYGARGTTANPPVNWNPFAHAITYTAPSGALVFSAGTIQWSWGLGPHYLDDPSKSYDEPRVDVSLPEIRQAVANLFWDGGIKPVTPSGITLDTPVDTTPPVITAIITNSGLKALNLIYVKKTNQQVVVRISCNADEASGPVTFKLTLKDSVGTLATQSLQLAPGVPKLVPLIILPTPFTRVTKAGLYLNATLTITCTDAAGNVATKTQALKLRAQSF